MTDTQKTSLYGAENEVRRMLDLAVEHPTVAFHGSTLTLSPDRKFGDLTGVQRYVDRVLGLNWVRSSFPYATKPITVRERKGQEKAHYEPLRHVIAVPPNIGHRSSWAMREIVVLHEVAHHLAPYTSHGPQFAAAFLELVDGLMTPEAAFLLRTAFLANGVEIA